MDNNITKLQNIHNPRTKTVQGFDYNGKIVKKTLPIEQADQFNALKKKRNINSALIMFSVPLLPLTVLINKNVKKALGNNAFAKILIPSTIIAMITTLIVNKDVAEKMVSTISE